MIELNGNTAKITIADSTVVTLLVFKDKKFYQELPIPSNQDYGTLSNLPKGEYVVLHYDIGITEKLKETFTIV